MLACVREHVFDCVCARKCARARARMCVRAFMRACAHVYACVCAPDLLQGAQTHLYVTLQFNNKNGIAESHKWRKRSTKREKTLQFLHLMKRSI